MIHIILMFILLNIISCIIVRLIHGGRFELAGHFSNNDDKPVVYLIAGIKNQATTAYSLLKFPDKCIIPLNYSLLGYNPIEAGEQLNVLCGGQVNTVVYGISIGAKAICYSAVDQNHIVVLINPCVYPENVRLDLFGSSTVPVLRTASIIFELLSYSLGWFSVLPLLHGDMENKYSIALLADQLFWSVWGRPKYDNIQNIRVLFSYNDEILDNDNIAESFMDAKSTNIDTKHGMTGDPKSVYAYQAALNYLLKVK